MALDDVARFQPYEAAEVVAASFCCPLCLCRATQVFIAESECLAACRCSDCAVLWKVAMSDGQLLRMSLAPPRHLIVLSVTGGVPSLGWPVPD